MELVLGRNSEVIRKARMHTCFHIVIRFFSWVSVAIPVLPAKDGLLSLEDLFFALLQHCSSAVKENDKRIINKYDKRMRH